MTVPVSIIIPFRSNGDPYREANLTCVLDHLADTGLPLILADDGRESGPFNRSRAYNRGMALSPSDVYAFHEADMLVPLDQLHDAIDAAAHQLGLVVPFTSYRILGEEASRLVLSGADPGHVFPQRTMDNGTAVGAVGVCSAETMQAVGRWDTAFDGHGYDDRGMYRAFHVAAGPATFIDGSATHLWHTPAYSPWETGTDASHAANYSHVEVEATVRNRARMRRYRAATTADQIRALTMETEQ